MTDERLNELADACEKVAGPDRELDAAIWCAIEGVNLTERIIDDFEYGRPQSFTASLDAAMSLVPEGLKLLLDQQEDEWTVSLWADQITPLCQGHAPTPALAICAASLRARASSPNEQDHPHD